MKTLGAFDGLNHRHQRPPLYSQVMIVFAEWYRNTRTHTHAHTYTYTNTHINTHMQTYTHTHLHTHSHTHTQIPMYTHMPAHTHILTSTQKHTHKDTHMKIGCICKGENAHKSCTRLSNTWTPVFPEKYAVHLRPLSGVPKERKYWALVEI